MALRVENIKDRIFIVTNERPGMTINRLCHSTRSEAVSLAVLAIIPSFALQCGAGEDMDSIGSALMEEDGTIVLQLRAEGPQGLIGDALLRYPPEHPQYEEILQHLGGLKKGEVKQVSPWPDQ